MIRLPATTDPHALALAMANEEPLTQEQAALLTAELENARYTGLSTLACLPLLHDPTLIETPVHETANGHQLHAWLEEQGRAIAYGQATPTLKAKWVAKIIEIKGLYGVTYTFDPQTAPTFASIASEAVTDGVISQATVDEFRARYVSATYSSPASTIVEAGCLLSVADVEACR